MTQRIVHNQIGTSNSSAAGARQYHDHAFNISNYSRGGGRGGGGGGGGRGGGYTSSADGVNDLLDDYQVYHSSSSLSLIRRKEGHVDEEQKTEFGFVKTESSTPHGTGNWNWFSNR